MRFHTPTLVIGCGLLLAGCAQRPLPTWERPLARTQFQRVRTTAYFDGESDHRPYTNHNAIGTVLQTGPVNSAAADWGRWPEGTMFRLLQTGQVYLVDDYGWALAGRNTIDLYMPTRQQMDCWGAQHVDIQILRWGDVRESYTTLRPRARYRHVARMLEELKPQLAGSGRFDRAPAPVADTAADTVTPERAAPAPAVRLQPFMSSL
jgi:3D (Asp-Asp-Asp) domain-containing protein